MQNTHRLFALFVAGLCTATIVAGQTDVKIPALIRIVVPFSVGGSNDVIARAIAAPLSKRLGTAVIVDNKPGAGGVIGADAVAKAAPDGSVLLLTSSSFLTATATLPRVPYDTLGSFAPIAMVVEGPLLLAVSSSAPFKSLGELVAAARARPGVITYGSAGVGSVAQMATEMMNDAARISMLHVPYKGTAGYVTDLLGGELMVGFLPVHVAQGFVSAGKLTPLAVGSPMIFH